MKIEDNEAGWKTVVLGPGDDLADVPKTHQYLITKEIRNVFPNPVGWLTRAAAESPFPSMMKWLNALLDANQWSLQLLRGSETDKNFAQASFEWRSTEVATVNMGAPAKLARSKLPEPFRKLYSCVDFIDWGGYPFSGSLNGAEHHHTWSSLGLDEPSEGINPKTCNVFGYDASGAMLVYTDKGECAWLSIDGSSVVWLGTIAEGIDWIFAQLNAKRSPLQWPV